MKYKSYIEKITKALKEYKGKIDTQEVMYAQEKTAIQSKAEKMKGQWTDEYIAKYIAENNPYSEYHELMQKTRASYEPTVLHYLGLIKKSLDRYFNAPIKPDFANKIMSIKLSGLQLTDLEFEILKGSASSYMECRLLNQLAESRTKTEQQIIREDSETSPRVKLEQKTVQVNDPYIMLKMPDMKYIYDSFDDYSRYARFLLQYYAGINGGLAELANIDIMNAVTADAYFTSKADEKFLKVMDEANAILPESKIKRTLTENDRKLIDTLIDPKYPSLAGAKVREIAENSPELTELFLLDSRYAKYLDEE